jgi:hypothetical protein
MHPKKILNFTTSEAASGDLSPHTYFGLLVHTITLVMKNLWAKPTTDYTWFQGDLTNESNLS